MNLLVNTPEPMWRLRILTAREATARTITTLQRAGVLHPEQGSVLDSVDRSMIERQRTAVTSLLGDIEDVLTYAPEDAVTRVPADVEVFLTRPAQDIAGETRRVCAELTALHRQAVRLEEDQQRWRELGEIARTLDHRAELTTADFHFRGKHLFSRLAVLSRDEFDAVSASLEALTLRSEVLHGNEKVAVFLIGKAGRRAELESLVAHHGELVEPPEGDEPLVEFASRASREVARLAGERAELEGKITARTAEELDTLLLLREGLRAERERLAMLALACEAEYVTLFEGWVPESGLEDVSARLREDLGCVHIEASAARAGEEPPTRLRNPPVLRPFEVIVRLFSTPRYGEWDPTPVVAYFFALFFGLMLADAVYGLLLLVIARRVLPRVFADPEAEGALAFRDLLSLCAGAAIVMGILTGSWLGDFPARFLGAPSLAIVPALAGFYVEPMVFIVVSLCIGLVHVNLGHLLMVIRGVRAGQPFTVAGRIALFMLQLAAFPWILRLLRVDWLTLGDTGYTLAAALMLAAVLTIIVASVMERGPFLGSILWVFDISGILGDVMSYARLAGVGLATYFLAYSFNMMATLITGMMPDGVAGLLLGGALAVLVLLFGHVLNLVLSSITCFVHALRLCFVEFMFKFYEGGGRPYAPFRLRRRTLLPVKAGGEPVN